MKIQKTQFQLPDPTSNDNYFTFDFCWRYNCAIIFQPQITQMYADVRRLESATDSADVRRLESQIFLPLPLFPCRFLSPIPCHLPFVTIFYSSALLFPQDTFQRPTHPCNRFLRLSLPDGKFYPVHHRQQIRRQYLFCCFPELS